MIDETVYFKFIYVVLQLHPLYLQILNIYSAICRRDICLLSRHLMVTFTEKFSAHVVIQTHITITKTNPPVLVHLCFIQINKGTKKGTYVDLKIYTCTLKIELKTNHCQETEALHSVFLVSLRGIKLRRSENRERKRGKQFTAVSPFCP